MTRMIRHRRRLSRLALLLLISCGRNVELPVADLVARASGGGSNVKQAKDDTTQTRSSLMLKDGETLHFVLPRCLRPYVLLTWKGNAPGAELEILLDGQSPLRVETGGGNLRVGLGASKRAGWRLGLRTVGGRAHIKEAEIYETVPADISSSYKNGSTQPNVLLLIIDTLRADHLGCYGADESHTEELDRIASQGTLFQDAISQANGTLPSISSLLSGVYPHEHGVYDNSTPLESKWITLPELMKSHGFSTAAFVGAHHLNPAISGFGEGFDYFGECTNAQRPANEVVDDALRWLKEHRDDRFFLVVHLFDPHTPYAPPRWVGDLFYSGDPKDPRKNSMDNAWFPAAQRSYMRSWLGGITDLDWPLSMYAGEVSFASKEAGRMFDWLEAHDLSERTLAIVTADHGESLTEHGIFFGHAGMYQEVLSVPLMLKLPGVIPANRRITRPVENIGIYPTVAELLGLPLPTDVQSRPLSFSRTSPKLRTLVSEAGFHGSIVARRSNWKLILNLRRQYFSEAETELYDLSSDPKETNNLVSISTETTDSLLLRLRYLLAEKKQLERRVATRLSSEEKRKLEALGYIE